MSATTQPERAQSAFAPNTTQRQNYQDGDLENMRSMSDQRIGEDSTRRPIVKARYFPDRQLLNVRDTRHDNPVIVIKGVQREHVCVERNGADQPVKATIWTHTGKIELFWR